ncbi:hypothetical protein Q5H93_04045 [Hymenobacter sp. ASUV-10]|uniref:Uncharacterized protein n=1 Tax=Hymenobacter aranciens TaxID=3063996 RepID=A0ABT9B8B1_9BACT|nr:hypothetical protein [Hymenobacter sp. ASUV-10]MDO7873893.1 hypothetical protein [Hymenobacter sp. ASUV-10]
MDSGKLAFLQNFYTDVTLYVPAEAEVALAVAAPAPATPAAAPPPTASSAALPVAAPVAPAVALVPQATTVPAPPATTAPVSELATPPAPTEAAPLPAALHTTFSTLGSNAQGVVLLVRLTPEQFQKLPRNVFLNKLLQAIGLVMADVVLVNVEHEKLPVALVNLRQQLAATRVLAFGRYLLDITVRNTQIYEPVQFPSQNLGYLASADVEMVEYDVSLKKRLWTGLQRMFLQ